MIAIIGAGISGLSAAFYLEKYKIPYTVFEKSGAAGGCISTVPGDVLMENGPNTLRCDAQVWDILEDFGLKDRVQYPKPVSKARFILKQGKYRKLSPLLLLGGGFFSPQTKWALLTEFFNKSKGKPNETVSDFFRRRFSEELVDYAVNPFVSGIYAGNPEEILMRFAFPALAEGEREHGSLLRAMWKTKTKTGRKAAVSFREGMGYLPKHLAAQCKIRYNTPVQSLQRQGKHFLINGDFVAQKVVFSAPAAACADILKELFPELATALREINYPPMSVVHSVFRKEPQAIPPNGFGGLHPKVEGQFSAGSIWSSAIFEGRTTAEQLLFTTFVGGSLFPESRDLSNERIKTKVATELKRLFKFQKNPLKQHIYRWEKAIPQYDAAMLAVERKIDLPTETNIFFNANWWQGISVADCLKKGKKLAQTLAGH